MNIFVYKYLSTFLINYNRLVEEELLGQNLNLLIITKLWDKRIAPIYISNESM